MKRLLLFLSLIVFVSSCRKEKVRNGIEGVWEIESINCCCNAPLTNSGTFEFISCSRKENRTKVCVVDKKIVEYNTYLGTSYVTKSSSNIKLIKNGKEMEMNEDVYRVTFTEKQLVLSIIGNPKSCRIITLTRD